jgi:hypothetical protein
MSTTNQHIGEKMLKTSEIIYSHSDKYYKAIKFSNFNKNVYGESQSKHENL